MPGKVVLTVTEGDLKGREFLFTERDTCIVGRAADCGAQVPNDKPHRSISRHHCLLDINPPDVRIRDFGSLNGTWVNGEKIGTRQKGQSPSDAARDEFPEYDLKDSDEVRLGGTVFRVSIQLPKLRCFGCGEEIAEELLERAEITPGYFQCEACRKKTRRAPVPTSSMQRGRCCAACGRDVSGETEANRQGDVICESCQAAPLAVIQRLLGLAKTGRKELTAIKGYAIEGKLGQGGMGAVFRARHEETGERVALKIMLPKVAADPDGIAKFLREVENTKALEHRNVVELRESGCSDGTFFFTLEYCAGGSVDKLMAKRGGRLAIDEAIPIIMQTLSGLHYAHHAEIPQVRLADDSYGRGFGLVHRDLSPQNILLTGSGSARTVKISDLGLGKAFDTAGLSGQTMTGAAAGKPVFMPQQQVVKFKYARPEVDVWAAAACLYNMLTGAYPRDFVSGQDPWSLVLSTSAVPIRQRDPSIPKRLAEVIDAALVDKPNIGFQRAAELKRALEGVL